MRRLIMVLLHTVLSSIKRINMSFSFRAHYLNNVKDSFPEDFGAVFFYLKYFQSFFLSCINIHTVNKDDFLHYRRNSGIIYFVCLCTIALLGLISARYDQEKQERLDRLWTKR